MNSSYLKISSIGIEELKDIYYREFKKLRCGIAIGAEIDVGHRD